VHRRRRRDDDSLDVRVGEQLLKRLVARESLWQLVLGPLERGLERITDGDELGPRVVEGQLQDGELLSP